MQVDCLINERLQHRCSHQDYRPTPPLNTTKTIIKKIEEFFEDHMKIFNKKVEGNKPENGQNPMILSKLSKNLLKNLLKTY